MSDSPNKLWALGPFIVIPALLAAYYYKVPSFRDGVNERFPFVKEHFSQFVPAPQVVMIEDPSPDGAQPAPGASPPSQAYSGSSSPAVRRAAQEPPSIIPGVQDNALSLQAFAANPSLWPKTVTLRAPIEFPAVLNGKVIGTIKAPAGTDANLVRVNDQLLGLEYRGGGAWVPISRTDLMERARITSR